MPLALGTSRGCASLAMSYYRHVAFAGCPQVPVGTIPYATPWDTQDQSGLLLFTVRAENGPEFLVAGKFFYRREREKRKDRGGKWGKT